MATITLNNSARSAEQNSKRFYFVHWGLLIILLGLIIYGLVIQYSACSQSSEPSFRRVILGTCLGLVAMFAIWWFDYRKLEKFGWIFLGIAIVLILMPRMPVIGVYANGAYSWVKIGPLSFQPSEFAKFFIILYTASLCSQYKGSISTWKDYLKVLTLFLIPFVLIFVQPDLGTGLVYLVIACTTLFTGGTNKKFLLVSLGVFVGLVAIVLLSDAWIDNKYGDDNSLIKDYQMNRLLVFLDEDLDPDGVGYNLQQAKIAIGSGGLAGKGLGNSTQASGGFLPEFYTDFIFAFLCEEMGFIGGFVLIILYILLLAFSFTIAFQANNTFGTLIATGCMGMWFFQILENIGMCMGLMPVTGIPLPFISYGSTALVTNFCCIGLMLSVWARRSNRNTSSFTFKTKLL